MSPRAHRCGLIVLAGARARSALLAVVAAVAVAAVTLAPLALEPAESFAAPAPPGAATPGAAADSASLSVDTFAPDVGRPGGTLALSGTLRSGADPIAASVVHVRVGTSPVAFREQLTDVVDGRLTPSSVPAAAESTPVDLAADTTRAWSVRSPLDDLGLRTPGAYPVFVDLDSATTGVTITRTVTFLSWFPTGSVGRPTRVVWTVPLVGTPSRDADGVFVDDRTATALAPGGRLRNLLDAVAGTTATWVVDPELLEAARAMSGGYQVLGADGDVTSGSAAGAAAAASFLAAARRDLATGEVVSLGYADPDVNALQSAGLTTDLRAATLAGPPLTAQLLGRRVTSTVAWPPGGAAQRAALATLRSAGDTAAILSDDTLPIDPTVTYTPTGLARVGTSSGSMQAALADSTLSAVVGDPGAQGGPALARARYLAETLTITEQRPSDPRTLVVAPPRLWDVSPTFAHDIVTTSNHVPWLASASLQDLLSEPLPTAPRGPLTYPDAARRAELSTKQTDGAAALAGGITTFTDVLDDPAATTARYRAAQLRTVSGAFRTQRAAGLGLLAAVDANLDRDRAKVRVLSRGTVTLSGANGQIPVTVANDLDQAVVVRVRLLPASPVRLRVDQPGDVSLGPHLKETLEVSARAATGGTVPVKVALLTRAGNAYSAPVTIDVRSTAYSRVALAVVGFAALALLVLVAVRLARRVRAARNAG